MNKRYAKELTIEELADLPEGAIDTSDIPPLDETFWQNAQLVEPAPYAASSRGKHRAL
ncbi:hypothetical protein ACUSIJ_08595 [Pseudochelatococcus sp. B33]